MDTINTFFDKYVNFPKADDDQTIYITFIILLIVCIILLILCNICICYWIRQRRQRELIDYPSNTLQYIRFPRNIRKPYRTSSSNSSNKTMLPASPTFNHRDL